MDDEDEDDGPLHACVVATIDGAACTIPNEVFLPCIAPVIQALIAAPRPEQQHAAFSLIQACVSGCSMSFKSADTLQSMLQLVYSGLEVACGQCVTISTSCIASQGLLHCLSLCLATLTCTHPEQLLTDGRLYRISLGFFRLQTLTELFSVDAKLVVCDIYYWQCYLCAIAAYKTWDSRVHI